jgi:hypothetical protein
MFDCEKNNYTQAGWPISNLIKARDDDDFQERISIVGMMYSQDEKVNDM